MKQLHVINGKVIMFGEEYELVYPKQDAEKTAEKIIQGMNEEFAKMDKAVIEKVVSDKKPKKKK